jgi:hypothetical protein
MWHTLWWFIVCGLVCVAGREESARCVAEVGEVGLSMPRLVLVVVVGLPVSLSTPHPFHTTNQRHHTGHGRVRCLHGDIHCFLGALQA